MPPTKDKCKRALLKLCNKMQPSDKKLFEEWMGIAIQTWALENDMDLMMANRLVTTFIRIRFVEKKIGEMGMFFEYYKEDKQGKSKLNYIKMNELVYYLRSLESDMRKYYRLLSGRTLKTENPTDFSKLLEDVKVENGPKKNKN